MRLAPDQRRGFSLGVLLAAKGNALLDAVAPRVLDTVIRGKPSTSDDPDVSVAVAATGEAASAGATARSDVESMLQELNDATQVLDAAEAAFQFVAVRYLSLGDNFALLLLDCVWASLLTHLLGSSAAPHEHTAAVARLERAKGLLRELHGEGLSKLANRADTGAQRAVYVRVNLLQGALAFLRGEAPDALSLFRKAERLLQELTITEDDDDHIASLVALGVSSHVARASLVRAATASHLPHMLSAGPWQGPTCRRAQRLKHLASYAWFGSLRVRKMWSVPPPMPSSALASNNGDERSATVSRRLGSMAGQPTATPSILMRCKLWRPWGTRRQPWWQKHFAALTTMLKLPSAHFVTQRRRRRCSLPCSRSPHQPTGCARPRR